MIEPRRGGTKMKKVLIATLLIVAAFALVAPIVDATAGSPDGGTSNSAAGGNGGNGNPGNNNNNNPVPNGANPQPN